MIRHVVVFTWLPGASDAQKQAVTERLAELPSSIPTVRRYSFGADAGINDGNDDFAIVADFDSVDDYVAYRDHPAHQALITECIAPIRASRTAVQFELPQ